MENRAQSPRWSLPLALFVLGVGGVAASAAIIAVPGFRWGMFMWSLLLLVMGRGLAEAGFCALFERVSGLGINVWNLLAQTSWGDWWGKSMSGKFFNLTASVLMYLLAITASQGVAVGNLEPVSVVACLLGAGVYVAGHALGHRLAKARIQPLAPHTIQIEA